FPIDPDKIDINAMKTLFKLIDEDEKIVIFPEGKTHSLKEEVPFKPGIPKISSKKGTLIVPFGITGTYIPFTDLKISIGSPINYKLLDIPKEEYDSHLESEVRFLQKKASNL
ncbi:MAG: 1-acyl-sn-glycerol-3-phosphate acyltransferase, partial [Bacilli bacterium]|nr:1-acyl-sn-glycerol-3-phosphate acyltransferase [Bacilli bacterium]